MIEKGLVDIMPDYTKSRGVYFKIDCFLAALTFLVEMIMFTYLKYRGLIEEDITSYLLLHVIIPSSLNGLILIVTAVIRNRLPKDNTCMPQNVIPIFAMLFIGLVITIAHSAYFSTIAIFCIPICMSAMFNMRKLCSGITLFSVIAALVSGLKHYFSLETDTLRIRIFPELLIMIAILLIMGKVVDTIMNMTEGQKQKLLKFARESAEAHSRSEAANMAKSAFLANMSHEIRTPINAVLGMNEMILRENENMEIAEYALNIQSAGESLLCLINDVLDISKIESGKLEIAESTYETASFIHNCYNMVAERAEKKGLDFIIKCNPFLPSQMRGDEPRLRQVISNLLTNSVKYTMQGSITMIVDKRHDGDKLTLVVSVEDTGIGIKKENLEHLFSQFSRFDLEKNRNIEGTGLGLAIAKQLVDLMHGELTVESEYGKGSTFTFTVPQQVISNVPMGDFNKRYLDISNKNAVYKQSFEAPNARILVVDDVPVNLKVISGLLSKSKIKIDTAESGMQCLSLVTKNVYDIIFMDHMMPEMDGIVTYKRMKELPESLNEKTPVIMLTANAISGAKELYMEAGFSNYLSKPIRSDKLEKMIIDYLPKDKLILRNNEENDADASNKENISNEASDKENISSEASDKAEKSVESSDEGAASFDEAEKDNESIEDEGIIISPKNDIDNLFILQRLYQSYPRADLSLGLSYCGQNPDIYLMVLQTYAENPKTDDLKSFYEERDLENYRILVHGIKSSSLNIGFSQLSEKAKALEMAAKESNWDFITKNHDEFFEEYKSAVSAINSAM